MDGQLGRFRTTNAGHPPDSPRFPPFGQTALGKISRPNLHPNPSSLRNPRRCSRGHGVRRRGQDRLLCGRGGGEAGHAVSGLDLGSTSFGGKGTHRAGRRGHVNGTIIVDSVVVAGSARCRRHRDRRGESGYRGGEVLRGVFREGFFGRSCS